MKPIRYKALAAIVTTCFLGLLSVSGSLWFAATTESDAAAINIAGSLRMQAWRLSDQISSQESPDSKHLLQLIKDYDDSLTSKTLLRLGGRTDIIGTRYSALAGEWQSEMRPLLNDETGWHEFSVKVPGFVDRIDDLVNALQLNTERKLHWLVILAIFSLCSILAIGAMTVRYIRLNLIKPVEQLSKAARKVRRGEFDHVRLDYQDTNEMGQLTATFSAMAESLSILYGDLEAQVSRQTCSLEQSNTALQLLYESSQTLGMNPYDEQQLMILLERWKVLLGLKSAYVCLTGNAGSMRLQRIYPQSDSYNDACDIGQCEGCVRVPTSDIQFPLSQHDQGYGYLHISLMPDQTLTEESRQWLRTFGDIVSSSLYRSGYQTQERRLLLMEERAVIARELHDSLAQALSYQKIQVTRLKKVLTRIEVDESVHSIVEEIREGVNNAYRQLRELLNTFRLSMSTGSLEEALKQTMEEYGKRDESIEFDLDYRLRFCHLDAHHQIHVLQIVREGLVNVIQHSEATKATVTCEQVTPGIVQVLVDDDGTGFSEDITAPGHYGTTIMQERAESLGGQLNFEASDLGGARVRLEFSSV
ncbi:histidine kinase [Endozoicomonas arenosclerae]|uniref:histidine kinase n=1 Tax=Endozoicomonas arenosclerae TaxID=1633495 RepID=UPI0007846DAC|nr:histidine kinase [Endozoicomonas arenosclerae]